MNRTVMEEAIHLVVMFVVGIQFSKDGITAGLVASEMLKVELFAHGRDIGTPQGFVAGVAYQIKTPEIVGLAEEAVIHGEELQVG